MASLVGENCIGPYPYKLLKQLGEGAGGTSVVYLATTGVPNPPELGDLVVLKIANVAGSHSQFCRDTLHNEVEHLRKLRHPGIVRLRSIQGHVLPSPPHYTAQTTLPGKPWFSVMEYLAGGSLADLLREQPKLEPRLALRVAQQVAGTLSYIHQQGYVHLDIKPENVVFRRPLNEAVESVLVDFGIARKQNQGGLEAGTLLWSPPERVASLQEGIHPVRALAKPAPAVDVYALGLLLYRMVAGCLPFAGPRYRIIRAIVQGNPVAPSHYEPTLSLEVDRVILGAVARNPAVRPTAAQLGAQLEAARFKLGSPVVSATDGPLPRGSPCSCSKASAAVGAPLSACDGGVCAVPPDPATGCPGDCRRGGAPSSGPTQPPQRTSAASVPPPLAATLPVPLGKRTPSVAAQTAAPPPLVVTTPILPLSPASAGLPAARDPQPHRAGTADGEPFFMRQVADD